MSDNTNISYVDATWSPVIGCTKCSPGCKNCYAEKFAWRMLHHSIDYQGVVNVAGWTGKVKCLNHRLNIPLHWRKPRTILVPSMGDLFHPKLPEGYRIDVFDVIAQAAAMGHTILVLTKRIKQMAETVGDYCEGVAKMDGVHLGVTICNQEEADEKIPILLQIPAAHRWISAEPLLGDLDLWKAEYPAPGGGKQGAVTSWPGGLDWVVVGCESGPNRRPCKLEWIRSIVRQCKAAGVKIFVKQIEINGKVEHEMSKFPKDLQVREKL